MKFFSKFIENVREKLIFFLPIFFFLPSLYLHFSPVEPVQRGFFCDDESLNYPFEEKETVPSLICLIIWMSIGVLLMLFKRKTFLKDFFMFVLGFRPFQSLARLSHISLNKNLSIPLVTNLFTILPEDCTGMSPGAARSTLTAYCSAQR